MQRLIAHLNIDPYLLLLVSTVALASVLPARGVFADIAARSQAVARSDR